MWDINLAGIKLLDDFNNLITRGIVMLHQLVIFKLKENVIAGDQSKLDRRLFCLGAPHLHEGLLVYLHPVRRPAIGHNDHFDPSASLGLKSYYSSATEHFIIRMRREYQGAGFTYPGRRFIGTDQPINRQKAISQ
jgi:hypothetical protein